MTPMASVIKPTTRMTTSVVCTPFIVIANMSLPTSLSTPNGWSPSWMPAPPSHDGRSDIVGPSSATVGTTSVCAPLPPTGDRPGPDARDRREHDEREHDQRDHRALVAEEPPADDLHLAEPGDLFLLEQLLVGDDGSATTSVWWVGSSCSGAVMYWSTSRIRGSRYGVHQVGDQVEQHRHAWR